MRTQLWLKLIPGLLLVLLVGTAFAGGVVITLDTAVAGVTPNTPVDVAFTIRSAHDQSLQADFHPVVIAVNAATGATLTFDATALADPGRYMATVTLPAGTWNWSITPDSYYPSELVAVMTPLEVSAAPATVPAAAPGLNAGLLWVGLPLAALLALAFIVVGRRRRPALSA